MNHPKTIEFVLNGEPKAVCFDADEKLSAVLRRERCLGVKVGCDEGMCGACTVLLDGRAVNACLLYAFQAAGRHIETIEFLDRAEGAHPLQVALAEEGAVQCGFCTPGVVLSAKALLDERPGAPESEIKEHLDGHLCRCTGYEKILVAIRRVATGASTTGAE